MSDSVYILQKDMLVCIGRKPFIIKKGEAFKEAGEYFILNGQGWMMPKESVIGNEEWFKLRPYGVIEFKRKEPNPYEKGTLPSHWKFVDENQQQIELEKQQLEDYFMGITTLSNGFKYVEGKKDESITINPIDYVSKLQNPCMVTFTIPLLANKNYTVTVTESE